MKWINTAVDESMHKQYKDLGVTWTQVLEAGIRILDAVGPDNFEEVMKSLKVPATTATEEEE